MSDVDVIAIGSGHTMGWSPAAYAAVAGKKVLVLERNAWFGGGVVTRELTLPRLQARPAFDEHIFIQGNPMLVNDELGLKSKYGLKYIFPDTPMMSVFEDGRTLKLHRDTEKSAASIAQFSLKDAEAFRKVSAIAQGWFADDPGLALHARRCRSVPAMPCSIPPTKGRELWRVMQMSSHDHLCELFESDEVRMHFARVAGENLVSPDEKGDRHRYVRVPGLPREVRLRRRPGRQRQA